MKMFKKMARGGAIASSKKMAPAVGGVVAAKTAQPMAAQAAKMPDQAPLSNLRSSVKSVATNVKTAIDKQPALQKPAIGAALQKKPVGRVVTGLVGKFIKRR